MDFSDKNIDILITRFLSGNLSAEEKQQLEQWVAESRDNYCHFQKMKNLWEVAHPLFDVRSISTIRALNRTKQRIGLREKSVIRLYRTWSKIAAILFIPVLLGLVYMVADRWSLKDYSKISYQQVKAPYGTHIQMNLPDGSIVWLNSGGELKYPTKFRPGERSVYLNGEAFFEVCSDKENPFIVHTEDMVVKATGTAFNVEGYSNDTIEAVTMVNGIVEVALDRSKETLNLKPGQRINYNTKRQDYSVEEVDAYKWCAWKDGKLIFRDEPLGDVFRKIGQVYNADIVVMDKELAKHIYRATFQGESLDEILRLMKLTVPMKYIEKTSKGVTPNGVYSKRYIEVVRL